MGRGAMPAAWAALAIQGGFRAGKVAQSRRSFYNEGRIRNPTELLAAQARRLWTAGED
jgi:hypothetical protein